MKNIIDKHTIINLKKKGHSNRSVERITGIDRKTVAKYWDEFSNQESLLVDPNVDLAQIQESMLSAPKYDTSSRVSRKYTEELDSRLNEILRLEEKKDRVLGAHKQNLTRFQIHNILVSEGFDISYSTIAVKINEKLKKNKECFIRQSYELGDRLEYDFGEVKLIINGDLNKYYLVVVSSPAANFRWAFLYKNQKKEVFMDSHVRIFEMLGGVYGVCQASCRI